MPELTVNTKYYHFRQNNSGGYFIENDDVAQTLIIEALNAKDAVQRMREILLYSSYYYNYCGKRWSEWIDDQDITEEPVIEGSTIIYYLDGSKEKINY